MIGIYYSISNFIICKIIHQKLNSNSILKMFRFIILCVLRNVWKFAFAWSLFFAILQNKVMVKWAAWVHEIFWEITCRTFYGKDYVPCIVVFSPCCIAHCSLTWLGLQVITYNGFYDHNLEWVGLEGVQIVASMNAGTGLGRHKLTTRFTSIVRICCIGYT